VLSVPIGEDVALGAATRHELWRRLPFEIAQSPGGSGFEGVACDGVGRCLILQEGPSRVLVMGPELIDLEAVIGLAVASDQPGFGAGWASDDNARGEGLLLMHDGHLLVAKQREPVCLIEFGPAGDTPRGVRPGTLLDRSAHFVPAGAPDASGVIPYSVLGWWTLTAEAAERLGSANDLSANATGDVLVASSRSRRVARIQPPLDPGRHEVEIDEDWKVPDLPDADERRPEALAEVPGAVLVGFDTRLPGDNLLVLEPLV